MIRRAQSLTTAIVACAALAGRVDAQQSTTAPVLRGVDVDGYRMRVQISGLMNRLAGRPTIVFEAGAGNSLEAWHNVVTQLIGTLPFVAYDRAGLGESAWDNQTPTPKHVSTKLRRLLKEIGADPPYILVGHSWGGSLMRFFAGYYPDEVVGIVYVDPGPIVTQSVAQELAPFEEIGAGRAGYEAFWSRYESLLRQAAPAVRGEFNVYRELMQRALSERDLRPAPNVPVVMVLAAKPYPPLSGLPFDAAHHFNADLRHRIDVLQNWALISPRGTMVVTNHTTHAVPREDPDLIVWAVQRVLSAIR